MRTQHLFVFVFVLGLSLASLPAAPKEGDLVQGSGPGVFLMHNGKRRGIESAKQFEEMGLKWENVIRITDADLNAIPVDDSLVNSTKSYKVPKDGDLVQGSGAAVFIIRKGQRHGIANAKQFAEMGLKWEDVIKIADADLNRIPSDDAAVATPLRPYKSPKDGDLVQGSGAAVYIIRNGKRCGIENAKQFEALGLKWENVIKISDADLNAIPTGSL